MTEHTPGPWQIRPGVAAGVYLIDGPQGAIGEIRRNAADARLIAAAPAMLAALREVRAGLTESGLMNDANYDFGGELWAIDCAIAACEPPPAKGA